MATTTCPNGHRNPDGVKYCGECGRPMAAGVRDLRRTRRIVAGALVVVASLGA